MTLQQAIQSIPEWQSKTAAELLTALQAVTVTTTDSQLYTYAGIIDEIGIEAGFGFRATMRTIAADNNPFNLPLDDFEKLNFAHERFVVGGLDLSRSDVQTLLDSMVAIPQLAPFIPALKAIGVQVSNPWGNTTLAEVETALAAIQLETLKQSWRVAAAARYNAHMDAIEAYVSGEEPVL